MVEVLVAEEGGHEFVSFNEFEDVVLAVELIAMLARDVRTKPGLWKWIIIGTQNAVQGAMVVALAGTDGCGALAKKSQQRNRAWLDNITPDRPPRVMATYPELLARVQDPMLMEGVPLALSTEEHRNLERLNELRRGFAHFNPTGWGIEVNYMLGIMPVALTAIEFLLKHPRPQIHLSGEQKTRIQNSIAARAVFAVQQ